MASGRIQTRVAEHPAPMVGVDVGALPDEDLIDRFLNQGGNDAEAAFRMMVVRHGPMVLGVCRHVLNQHQDAEDAFQATFVVLARKAGSIQDRRVLGRWLYEVAYRIALRAKSSAVRRRTVERQGAEMSVTAPEYEAGWNELRPVLHEEVNRLPEKYRTPVVLCYLEGKTNEEVAQLLRWPVGTVKGRLSRARELLRARLTRRGLALSAAFLTTALSHETVFAELVPSRLVDSTVRTAMRSAKLKPAAAPSPHLVVRNRVLASQVALVTALVIVIATALTGAGGRYPALISVQFPPDSHWPTVSVFPGAASCHTPSVEKPVAP